MPEFFGDVGGDRRQHQQQRSTASFHASGDTSAARSDDCMSLRRVMSAAIAVFHLRSTMSSPTF